ncbi:MAG: hypothetical protein IT355_18920 [Gemmatimonadaceae bacterium]|nr:hypothetical protein [Gemmatimonadaceae bacterium]
MTDDPNVPRNERFQDVPDAALDALLRRHDPAARLVPPAGLDARILDGAAFALAGRRRAARTSMADTLAAWVRVALPMAAAAAIFAATFIPRMEATVTGTIADAELRDSDPAALLSALESDGSSGLANHLIASDALPAAEPGAQ